MFKEILSDLGGIGVYGVLSTLLFFAAFVGMVVWVLRMKKSHVESMKHLPLEPDKPRSEEGEKNDGEPDER